MYKIVSILSLVIASIFSFTIHAEQYVECHDSWTGNPIYSTEQNRLNTYVDCRPISFGNIPPRARYKLTKQLDSLRDMHREWSKIRREAKKMGAPPGCEYVFCFNKEQCDRDIAYLGQECVDWYSGS